MSAYRRMNRAAYRAIAFCLLLLPASNAWGIVLIDDFNESPEDFNLASGNAGPASYSLYSPISYVPYVNNGAGVGIGTLGGTRRLATYGANTTIGANSSGGGENLLGATSNLSTPTAKALFVLDGTTDATKPNITFASDGTYSGAVGIDFDNLNADLIHYPGDPERGIILQGLNLLLSGSATMRLAFFQDAANYAIAELTSADNMAGGDLYIPFTGFDSWYAQDNPVFTKFGTSSMSDIFNDVGAIVIEFSNNGVNASTSFNVKFDAIYSGTPEPGSLLIWGVLGIAAIGRSRRRFLTRHEPANDPELAGV